MTTIDPLDPNPMNRFHGISDPKEACAIVRGMIDGVVYPEVTLWRLHSFCEMAMWTGKRIGEGKMKDPHGLANLP